MFVVGYVSKEEKQILEKRGWEVESAQQYNLVGSGNHYLMEEPEDKNTEAVVIWVDSDVFEVMSGPDWDQ